MGNQSQRKIVLRNLTLFLAAFFIFCAPCFSQNAKRVVIVKVDGLPNYYVDRFVKEKDAKTGKSLLPWFEEIFYKNGTRLENFYSRGMSLSATSWSTLDTGQHLQIKGNVEFDRYTLRSYDYLNIIPYYVNYGLKKRADMPGVEVFDQLKIPLLYDAFPYQNRYTSYQLFQRGVEWEVLAGGFIRTFPTKPSDFMDEWTIGFDLQNMTFNQTELDIIGKLEKNPEINYFDFYITDFDHISHTHRDLSSRFHALKDLDRKLGRIWTAIQNSSRADETALILVSDHGFNSDEKTYSQGFNLVKLLGSAEGGGHHVLTKRRLMLDYSIKGINPFVPLITTTTSDSYYLKGQSTNYPTAMIDFDGNERSSIHLRDNDLNLLQILLQQLKDKNLSPALKQPAINAFFEVVNRRRAGWEKEISEITKELDALQNWITRQQAVIKSQPKKLAPEQIGTGADKEIVRLAAQVEISERDEISYREYLRILSNLVALKPETFDPAKIKIEDYIGKNSMGDENSIYDLQNYIVGLSAQGLAAGTDNRLDLEKSFKRINYFELLENKTVRNNVQPNVSNQPIEFIARRISLETSKIDLSGELSSDEEPIWLYGGLDKQALILTHKDAQGSRSYRYLPIANLRQTPEGNISFERKNWDAGFPLKIFEDANLKVSSADKASWLNAWHSEEEWFEATHKTLHSNAIIGLNEQMDAHPLTGYENESPTNEDKLIHRFRLRQRRLTETDLLLMVNNHWNFDVRGFNPGGNHGSFYRVSTNSTLMAAGGAKTGIPRGLEVEKPYDNLSFVPTIFALMGKINEKGEPNAELYKQGFRKFPGRIINEIASPQK
jgi:hypothetical protein